MQTYVQTNFIDFAATQVAVEAPKAAILMDRPWAHLTVAGVRPLHNVAYVPGFISVDDWIAIYATLRFDSGCVKNLNRTHPDVVSVSESSGPGVIGVAKVSGFISESDSYWFSGFLAIEFSNFIVFDIPISVESKFQPWELGPSDRLAVASAIRDVKAR